MPVSQRATFREFLDARRDMENLATWDEVAKAAGVGIATVGRIVRERPGRHATTLASRNPVAVVLGFKNWGELEKEYARTAADLAPMATPDVTELVLPTPLVTAMHASAARRRMTLEQWLWQQIQPK